MSDNSHNSQNIDQWAHDHAHSDKLAGLIYRRGAHFESAQQFGFFCSLVIEQWDGGRPGMCSWAGGVFDTIEMGAVIQTNPDPSHIATPPAYHHGWIRDLLGMASLEAGRTIIQMWGQKDMLGRAYRPIAKDFGCAHSTARARVARGRDAIYAELVRAGRASRAPR